MSSPRIAIVTCVGYDDHKVDDGLLLGAMEARGAEVMSAIWDDRRVDWGEFDLCLVRSTWDYNDKHAQFLEWARRVEAASALLNPAELIAWNSEKTYLRGLCARGVPIVPTMWIRPETGIDAEALLAERGWEEAVVKPIVDLGARNLRRVRAGSGEARAALEEVLSRGEAMVQPFLPSLETEGELSLIYLDGRFSHAVRKRPARDDFRVQSIWGGTAEPAEPTAGEMEVGQRALTQLDEPPLYARVDLVAGPEGEPLLIELELIEPNLYLETHPGAAERLAGAALLRVDVDADRDVLE